MAATWTVAPAWRGRCGSTLPAPGIARPTACSPRNRSGPGASAATAAWGGRSAARPGAFPAGGRSGWPPVGRGRCPPRPAKCCGSGPRRKTLSGLPGPAVGDDWMGATRWHPARWESPWAPHGHRENRIMFFSNINGCYDKKNKYYARGRAVGAASPTGPRSCRAGRLP